MEIAKKREEKIYKRFKLQIEFIALDILNYISYQSKSVGH